MSFDQEPSIIQTTRPAAGKETEVPIWSGSYSAKAMAGSCILAALATLAVITLLFMLGEDLTHLGMAGFWSALILGLMWLYIISLAVYRILAHHFELTTQRLKHRDGIIFTRRDRMELIDVDDVLYFQGPIQKLLGVGDIVLESSDKTHPQLIMYGIANVTRVADMIDDARREERRRRGFHVNN